MARSIDAERLFSAIGDKENDIAEAKDRAVGSLETYYDGVADGLLLAKGLIAKEKTIEIYQKLDAEEAVRQGVNQAMEECKLTIGMTLKEAVEKQIPKIPVNLQDHYFSETYDYGYTSFNCPCCGEELTSDEYHQPKFCPNCGQKLDWRTDNGNGMDQR